MDVSVSNPSKWPLKRIVIMPSKPFMTNQDSLEDLLRKCDEGRVQLPDFQRNWSWEEDRVISLISSVSQAFPIGAIMTLRTGSDLKFKNRRIEGVPKGNLSDPEELILDGQQRLTSLYQSAYSKKPLRVKGMNSEDSKKKRWLYFNLISICDGSMDRELTIEVANENRIIKSTSNGKGVVDLSTREKEFEEHMFPISEVLNPDKWETKYNKYWLERDGIEGFNKCQKIYKKFKKRVLNNFANYEVPVMSLSQNLSREAICVVFDKVNTGGKLLDAFELVTAKFAAEKRNGYDLRDVWGDEDRGLRNSLINWTDGKNLGFMIDPQKSVLRKVKRTDFLQAVSLIKTYNLKRQNKTSTISGKRQDLLDLELKDFELYKDVVKIGFIRAAEFLYSLKILQGLDLPYRSQLVPLAVILADTDDWNKPETYKKLSEWYWCGVFGQLYSSANETRMAWDVEQVTLWIEGDCKLPATVRDASFRPKRLEFLRDRKSAPYKGLIAVLLGNGLMDISLGKKVSEKIFFNKGIDMHHIFPANWCEKNNKNTGSAWDSIINKTPLSADANRSIGDDAPGIYIAKFDGLHSRDKVDSYLESHLIDPSTVRSDDFEKFIENRKERLNELVHKSMGKDAVP